MAVQRATPKRIMIVEDHELNMRLLNDLLEAHGYDVIKTGDGSGALDLAREGAPDLILMDIQLPDVSGPEVARRLTDAARTPHLPLIAVTAVATRVAER